MSRRTLAALATLGVFVLAASPALASERYVRTGHFTGEEAPQGPLVKPTGVAVDESGSSPSGGDIYVVDVTLHVVEKFDSKGKYISEFTGAPTGEAGAIVPFSELGAVTVDNYPGTGQGDVYIADSINRQSEGGQPGERIPVIDQYSPTGAYLTQISGEGTASASPFFAVKISGLAIGPDGDLWITDPGGTVDNRGTHNGNEPSQVYVLEETSTPQEPWKLTTINSGGGKALGVALDSTKHAYLNNENKLERWSINPEHKFTGEPSIIVGKNSGSAVAAGTLTGDIFDEECPRGSESEAVCVIGKFGPLGESLEEKFGAELNSKGIAVDDAMHIVYATNSFGEVVIFKKVQPGPPAASTTPAHDVGEFKATITGRVNPEARPTTYVFQYSATNTTTSCPMHPTEPLSSCTSLPAVPLGENAEILPVSAELENLTPGAVYHYRVLAENPDGTAYGEDQMFTAEPYPPPAVTTGEVEDVTQTSVTLTGAVDPHEQLTNYQFEVGDTTAYGTTVLSINLTGAKPQPVRLILTNLVPGTVYHYRITANNKGGTGTGEDHAFITAPPLFAPPTLTTPPMETELPNTKPTTKYKKSKVSTKRNKKQHKRKKASRHKRRR
jgi:hypothetical protein